MLDNRDDQIKKHLLNFLNDLDPDGRLVSNLVVAQFKLIVNFVYSL